MVYGEFTAFGQAQVTLTLRNEEGEETEVTAVVDTGYMGFLMLPRSLAVRLGLPQIEEEILVNSAVRHDGLHCVHFHKSKLPNDGKWDNKMITKSRIKDGLNLRWPLSRSKQSQFDDDLIVFRELSCNPRD